MMRIILNNIQPPEGCPDWMGISEPPDTNWIDVARVGYDLTVQNIQINQYKESSCIS